MSPDDHQSTTARATAPDTKLGESGAVTAPISATADRKAIRPRAQHPLRREITPERWQLLVDILMLGAAIAAVVLTAPAADDPVENPVWLVILPLGVLALLTLRGMYGHASARGSSMTPRTSWPRPRSR